MPEPSAAPVRKWKRGDQHPETGLFFWALMHDKEYWVPEYKLCLLRRKACECQKRQAVKFPDKMRARHSGWCKKNLKKRRIWNIAWEKRNPEKNMALKVAYIMRMRQESPLFRLRGAMRCRIYSALFSNGKRKTSRTTQIIGCSPLVLQDWLEKQFVTGMTWENYGSVWVVDHRIPLASAINADEVIKLCHYTNLQPLWKRDNLIKSAKMPDALSV